VSQFAHRILNFHVACLDLVFLGRAPIPVTQYALDPLALVAERKLSIEAVNQRRGISRYEGLVRQYGSNGTAAPSHGESTSGLFSELPGQCSVVVTKVVAVLLFCLS
jgi:hypothetical protein